MAALAKDNGIAFAVIPPVVAFAFGMADRKTLVRHFMFGILIAVVYAAIRLSLPATYIAWAYFAYSAAKLRIFFDIPDSFVRRFGKETIIRPEFSPSQILI